MANSINTFDYEMQKMQHYMEREMERRIAQMDQRYPSPRITVQQDAPPAQPKHLNKKLLLTVKG